MRIAYLVNQYPKTSHSFIRREIRGVEALGVEVLRYSIRAVTEPLVEPDDRDEAQRTVVLLTRYRARPLHIFGYLGTAAGALGGLVLAYLAVLWLLGYGPIGTRPLLTFGLLLVVVGVQFFCTGLVAELIRETTARRQPPYVLRPPEDAGEAPGRDPPPPDTP